MAKLIMILACLQLPILFIFFNLLSPTNGATYNVIKYGAKPDGRRDSTKSFLRTWSSACNSKKPATMYVPRGRYLIKKIVFSGSCRNRIRVQIDGTIVAPPTNYWVIGNSQSWILFDSINGMTINGGTFDARGSRYWACKKGGHSCPQGAMSLSFNNVKNAAINGVKSINSQISHMSINGCSNMMIRRLTLKAPDQSPNTDGINIQMSTGVSIIDSSIKTGDDCIAIGPGTRKLLIQRVGCGPGHGISIGSLARNQKEAGVQDITVKDVTFSGSENGLRIKSWARPSTGFVKNVLYQNIVMNNVQNPIIIDQKYCPSNQGCPNQHSGIKISGVTYQNVRGTSTTQVAVKFQCSKSNPCQGIKLQDVKLTHRNRPAKSVCSNARGKSSGHVMPGSCL